MNKKECEKKVIICYSKDKLAPVYLNEEDRYLNMLVVGATGTGKSSQLFVPLIYQDIMNENAGVTVIDPKESLAEEIYKTSKYINRNVLYVDPTQENCPRLNPFDGQENIVTKNILKMFAPSFLIKSNEEKRDIEASRTLITNSIKLLKNFPDLCGNNLNIKSYYNFISNNNNQSRIKINKIYEQLRNVNWDIDLMDLCKWFLYDYFEPDKDTYKQCSFLRIKIEEIVSNKYLLRAMTPCESRKTAKIDFNEHLLNKDIVIINTKNTVLGHLGKLFGEFVMLELYNAVFQRNYYSKAILDEGGVLPPHFVYVDEFPVFSPVLAELFTQGRAFRVGTHIAIQNRQMLKMCGGENTDAQSLLIESNARNIVLFPGLNGEDSKYYSEQFMFLTQKEICYRPFGQIVHRLIKDKSVCKPDAGLVFFANQKISFEAVEKENMYE